MCKKILVAIDGSQVSLRALDYAATLGKQAGSELVIVNVVDDVSKANMLELSFAGRELYAELVKEMQKFSQGMLENAQEKLSSYPHKSKTISLFGNPVEKIMETVKAEHADCIVVGSRGLSKLSEMVVGSTTNKILQASAVPVLVVK